MCSKQLKNNTYNFLIFNDYITVLTLPDYLSGPTRTSRSPQEGGDVDGTTKVVVGSSNIITTTIADENAFFGSNSRR